MTGRLAGVVLAGGESRRMGRDKATLTVPGAFGGRTLLDPRTLAAIAAHLFAPQHVLKHTAGPIAPPCRLLRLAAYFIEVGKPRPRSIGP